MIRER